MSGSYDTTFPNSHSNTAWRRRPFCPMCDPPVGCLEAINSNIPKFCCWGCLMLLVIASGLWGHVGLILSSNSKQKETAREASSRADEEVGREREREKGPAPSPSGADESPSSGLSPSGCHSVNA